MTSLVYIIFAAVAVLSFVLGGTGGFLYYRARHREALTELDALDHELTARESELRQQRFRIAASQVQGGDVDAHALHEQVAHLREALEQRDLELNVLQQDYNLETGILRQEIAQVRGKDQQFHHDYETLRQEYEALRSQYDALRRDYDALHQEYSVHRNDVEAHRNADLEEVERLREQIREERARLAEERGTLESRARHVEEQADQVARQHHQFAARRQSLDADREQLETREAALAAQTQALEQARQQHTQRESELLARRDQLRERDRQLGQRAQELEARTAQILEARNEVEEAQAALNQAEIEQAQEMEQMHETMGALRQRLQMQEEELARLRQRLAEAFQQAEAPPRPAAPSRAVPLGSRGVALPSFSPLVSLIDAPAAVAAPPLPAGARTDVLTRLQGLDAGMQEHLYQLGITSYEQIARWSSADVRRVASRLGVDRGLVQNHWIIQSQTLLYEQNKSR